MLAAGIPPISTMASQSIKPYAVMDFDSLIATALSGHFSDFQASPPGGQLNPDTTSGASGQKRRYPGSRWTPEVTSAPWAAPQGHQRALLSQSFEPVHFHHPNSLALLRAPETHQSRGRLMSAPISSDTRVGVRPMVDLNSSLTNPRLSPLHIHPAHCDQTPTPTHSSQHHLAHPSNLPEQTTSPTLSSVVWQTPSSCGSWQEQTSVSLTSQSHSPGPVSGSSSSTLQSGGPVSIAEHLKPGPNLIRPIAYKPTNGSPARSPVCQVARRPTSGEEPTNVSQDMPRPIAVRLGTSMLGLQASPDPQPGKAGGGIGRGAFNTTRPGVGGAGGAVGGVSSFINASDAAHTMTHPPPSASNSSSALYNGAQAASHHPPGPPHLNTSGHSYHNISASSQHNLSANSPHISANSSHVSANSSHISANSSRLSGGEEASVSGEARPDSIPSLGTSRLWHQGAEVMLQTPSPSDSGVGELEAMLREKDAEINTLREVMDRNERAIFQVYEERRHAWMHDSQELKDDYERKLKVQSRKSYKTEQVLSLQVYKLQQEQKTLQDENTSLAGEKDALKQQLEESQAEVARLRTQQPNLGASPKGSISSETALGEDCTANQEEVIVKNKEIIRLKSELHALEAEMENKNKELLERAREVSTRNDQMSQMREKLSRLQNPAVLADASSQTTHASNEVSVSENVKPSALGERDRAISGLQEELVDVKTELEQLRTEQDKEREQWLEEKNKVVRYQKQLQLNYVQMQRKNSTLETEVQQLTLELENRDMKLIALSGEESVC